MLNGIDCTPAYQGKHGPSCKCCIVKLDGIDCTPADQGKHGPSCKGSIVKLDGIECTPTYQGKYGPSCSWMELTVHQHIKENMDLRVKAALSS